MAAAAHSLNAASSSSAVARLALRARRNANLPHRVAQSRRDTRGAFRFGAGLACDSDPTTHFAFVLQIRLTEFRGQISLFAKDNPVMKDHGAEAMCEGRSILLCWLRFCRGSLSFAWPFPRLWSSSVTNSTGFVLLFGGGRSVLAPLLAFFTQLLLVQIGLELFIGKTTA